MFGVAIPTEQQLAVSLAVALVAGGWWSFWIRFKPPESA
jgi:hypothetical protein